LCRWRHHGRQSREPPSPATGQSDKSNIYNGLPVALASASIDLGRVTEELEEEGVEKFAASFRSLLSGIDAKAGALTS